MYILLLEDNSTDADLTKRELISTIPNCTIDIAPTIKIGKEFIQKGNLYDIALLDMQLPDGIGLDLLTEIRQQELKTAIIMLTGSGNEEVAATALKMGANDYIVKKQDYISQLPSIIEFAISNFNQNLIEKTKTINVLYVEHNIHDIDLTKRHMHQYAPNLLINAVSTAEEALDKLNANKKFDVILMDYRLIGTNSMELIKIIRQKLKLITPIILVTGQGNEELVVQSLKLGASEYLTKSDSYLFRLPSLIISTVQKIELKKKQQALIDSEEKYRTLIENQGEGICIIDTNNIFVFTNPSAEKIFNVDSGKLIGQNLNSFIISKNNKSPFNNSAIDQLLCKKTTCEIEIKNNANQILTLLVTTTLQVNKSGESTGYFCIFRDITLRKNAEKELIIAKERAEESDRLKSAFLANMSHEIRTPMNGILGFIDLLNESNLDKEQIDSYSKIINKSGNRLLNTINNIIDISKIESGQISTTLSKTYLNTELDELFSFHFPDAKSNGITLYINPTLLEEEIIIYTDAHKLHGILTNLIKNAIKYTESGSIHFGYSIKNNFIEFFVKDTGIGIPENRIHAVFNRFEQADIEDSKALQGSGLGLTITKAYVEMLGGEIFVTSKEGEGSTFTFTLPLNTIEEENSEKTITPQPSNEFNFTNLNLLIVDDDDISSKLLETILEGCFKKIIILNNGQDAIDYCKNHSEIDLILMDIKMPVISGIDATREIRKFNKDVIIIAQTAYVLMGDKEKTIEAGCNDNISKPINKKLLLEIINSHTTKKHTLI